jgi:hypothetical protein
MHARAHEPKHDAVSGAQRSSLAGVLSVSEAGIPLSSEGDKA